LIRTSRCYLVGRPHPNRERFADFLRANLDETFVTSAEIYQEVIHRYIAIRTLPAIADCFAFLDDLVQQVYPITRQDIDRAHDVVWRERWLSGRDCLHVAVMERYGISTIWTADTDFDRCAGLTRVP
jgi:hypothetical protein